jgi:hypothetical protein
MGQFFFFFWDHKWAIPKFFARALCSSADRSSARCLYSPPRRRQSVRTALHPRIWPAPPPGSSLAPASMLLRHGESPSEHMLDCRRLLQITLCADSQMFWNHSTSSPSNTYDPMLTAGGTDSIGPSRLHSGEISGLRWFDPLLHDLVIASHLVLEVLILVFPGHNVLLFCVMYDDALVWFLCLGLIMLPSHGWFGSKQMF